MGMVPPKKDNPARGLSAYQTGSNFIIYYRENINIVKQFCLAVLSVFVLNDCGSGKFSSNGRGWKEPDDLSDTLQLHLLYACKYLLIDLTPENLIKVLCDDSSYHDRYTFSPEGVQILKIKSIK
jgi:hypothetical protein